MTQPTIGASSGASALDLASCDREPIHIPGSVQAHGALVVCSARDWVVGHVSENLGDILGVRASEALGRPIKSVFGEGGAHRLRNLLQYAQGATSGERFFGVSDDDWPTPFDLALRQQDGRIFIEIEKSGAERDQIEPMTLVKNVLERLQRASDLKSFCDLAARQMRLLTGYDRVMVYRFAEDGSGEVIAETRRDDLEPYLGLHYPASDIPSQARALYLKNRIRVIADVDGAASPMSPATDLAGLPIDMSYVGLRTVSPIHLQYLRNMGVRGSMSVSIVHGGRLWGLFACHHMTPRALPAEIRSACELFGDLFSLHIEAKERAAIRQAEREGRAQLDALTALLSPDVPLIDNLTTLQPQLGELLNADGVGFMIDGRAEAFGAAPSDAVFEALARRLDAAAGLEPFATHHLSSVVPEAAGGDVAGVLAVPISGAPRDYLLFFRRELARTVTWAGDPAKPAFAAAGADRLQPRRSFAAWTETVRGQSQAWTDAELAVAEALRISLLAMVARRAEFVANLRERAQERKDLLIAELSHRVKNMLALVRSLVRNGSETTDSVESFVNSLMGRIEAVAVAHDQATGQPSARVALRGLAQRELAPYDREGEPAAAIRGPEVRLAPEAAPVLSLVLHELATNAAKYGALSRQGGRVELEWSRAESGDLTLNWREQGGPPVASPTSRGFGSALIQRSIPYELSGEAEIRFEPTGLVARFLVPAVYVSEDEARAESVGAAQIRPDAPVDASPAPELALPEAFSVLVVEDNAIIALDLEDMLRGLGAGAVTVAGTVDEALQALSAGARIDIAILDVHLASGTSAPVAERLHARGAPFVFSTGYGDENAVLERYRDRLVVPKPYSSAAVKAALVRSFEALSSARAG